MHVFLQHTHSTIKQYSPWLFVMKLRSTNFKLEFKKLLWIKFYKPNIWNVLSMEEWAYNLYIGPIYNAISAINHFFHATSCDNVDFPRLHVMLRPNCSSLMLGVRISCGDSSGGTGYFCFFIFHLYDIGSSPPYIPLFQWTCFTVSAVAG
jgi:hypothetical protein